MKAVERALKSQVKGNIGLLNGGYATKRDMVACGAAAIRICTAVADILAAHSAQ